MLFRSSTVVSVIFLLLLGFVIAAYNGPANGLVITISDKRVRGLSVALVQFGANLVGFGLGPVFIGGLSEALGGGVSSEGRRVGKACVSRFRSRWSRTH